MLKLKWRPGFSSGYWVARLTPGLVVVVQPFLHGIERVSTGQIGLLDDTEFHCPTCEEHVENDEFVVSEPRTQHDVADAMARCEQLAADWVREQFGVLL